MFYSKHPKMLTTNPIKNGKVKALKYIKEMTEAGADWQLHAYGHAMHAFTTEGLNAPERGIRYDANADRHSWTAMKNFFESPAHQEIIHRLTGALARYAKTHQDTHFEKPNIAVAMQAVLKAK